jgi:TolB protein
MAGRARLIPFLVVAVAIVALGGFAVLAGVGRPASSAAPTAQSFQAGSPGGSGAGQPAGTDRAGPSAATPSAAAIPGSIATLGLTGSLSLVDSTGRSTVLSDGNGVAFGFPAWSPDGSRIAVVAAGANDTSISVYAVGTGAAAPSPGPVVIHRSATIRPFYLYWAPGGGTVSFLADEGNGLALRTAPADGSGPLDGSGRGSVIRRGEPLYYDWIGRDRLLLHVGAGSDAFLGEVGLDGAGSAPALMRPGIFRAAALSSDGRYVTWVRAGPGGRDAVVVASRDGSAEHTIPVFGIAAVVFDPTGDTIASIGADRPGPTDNTFPLGPLRLMDARTGQGRTLLDGLVAGFFWSPDGRTIAALRIQTAGGSTADSGSTLALAAASSPIAAPTASPSASPSGPSASPSGQTEIRLLFVDVATGSIRSQRTVSLGRRFVAELLPYFDQYALSHRLWAPDSSAFLLPLVNATDETQLVALRPDGGDNPLTIDGEAGFWSP